jgi:ABC-type bacteriocin/lantibiotic exporter with double-glycine peptidase domain
MSEKSVRKTPIWPAIRRLLQLSGKNQAWLYVALLVVVLETASNIAGNFTLARFIDAVSAGEYARFTLYLAVTAALYLAAVPLSFVRTRSIGLFGERTLAGLREKVAARATVLPMRTLEERHTGDLLAVVNADLAKLKDLAASSLIGVISQSLLAGAALAALFVISWPLALVSTLLIPIMFLIMARLNQPVAQRTQEMQQGIGETVSVAQDGLAGLMVTRAFNLAGIIDDRFRQANQRALGKGLLLTRFQAIADGTGAVFGVLPFLITFGFGGYLAINGYLTFGNLMAFVIMLNYVANPLSSLPPGIAGIAQASGSAQRIYQILDQEPERSDGTDWSPDEHAPTVVRMEHVHFAYDAEAVLEDVSLSVERGQTVAIVGPSGGGKSTLLKLLLGFYPLEDNRLHLFAALRQGTDGLCGPGHLSLSGQHRREYRLRQTGRHPGRDRTGGPDGQHPRVHCLSARGLRHPGRGARRAPVGRAAPTPFTGPGDPARRADPAAGRADFGPRYRIGGAGAGSTGALYGRSHHACHRPPPIDDPQRGPRARAGGRANRGARHPRRVDGPPGALQRTLPAPVR